MKTTWHAPVRTTATMNHFVHNCAQVISDVSASCRDAWQDRWLYQSSSSHSMRIDFQNLDSLDNKCKFLPHVTEHPTSHAPISGTTPKKKSKTKYASLKPSSEYRETIPTTCQPWYGSCRLAGARTTKCG